MAGSPARPPVLRDADGQDVAGKSLALTRQGLELRLDVAEGTELGGDCTLDLLPVPGAGAALELETLAPSLSCDLGAFPNASPVAWVLADWGADKPIASLHVQTAAAGKARVKVFSHGSWLPLQPLDIIATGSPQAITPQPTGKVLVELVAAGDFPGVWKPSPAAVTGLAVQAATLPGDVEMAVAGQSLGFRRAGLLPSQGAPAEGFAAAVNAHLADPQAARPVPVRLAAGQPGRVLAKLSPAAVTVARQLRGGGELPVAWRGLGGRAEGFLDLPENAELRELGFSLEAEWFPEALAFPSPSEAPRQALYASPMDGAAQAFRTGPEGLSLAGLDLRLDKRGPALQATLALHPDLHGRPAPNPYGGAQMPLSWPAGADPRGADGWARLTLPRPARLPDADWWAVLTVRQGEAFWALADAPPEQAGPCLYRKGEGAWLGREGPGWAQSRLRLAAPPPQAPASLALRRGQAEAVLAADGAGRFQAGAAALASLNADPAAGLKLVFSAPAAGRVVLRQFRAVYR